MVICPFAPYGLAHGPKTCQNCHKLGPDFAERISLKLLNGFAPFKVSWTCLDLLLCNVSLWASLCGTHISATTGWIYTTWSSMELSRPVVVQHHGHLTLTLDFQGQILKIMYLRNVRANWHGTKGMWVDRMLDPFCDFQRSPHPWPWPWIFKVKFWKVVS